MSDQPYVENDDMPYTHHPIEYLPWLNTDAEVEVFQLRPTQEYRLAEWIGGKVAFEDGEIVVAGPGVTVRMGEYVIRNGDTIAVEPAEGFHTRYWPKGRDPRWPHARWTREEGA